MFSIKYKFKNNPETQHKDYILFMERSMRVYMYTFRNILSRECLLLFIKWQMLIVNTRLWKLRNLCHFFCFFAVMKSFFIKSRTARNAHKEHIRKHTWKYWETLRSYRNRRWCSNIITFNYEVLTMFEAFYIPLQ